MIWAKIDRRTGKVLRKKEQNAPMERVFDKPTVWIEQEIQPEPDYDPDTHKVIRKTVQPDLSDLSVDVDPNAKRVEGWEIVALSDAEKERRMLSLIALTDHTMARVAEDIMVSIASNQELTRDSFSEQVWQRVNARRRLRGESDV
jgi:hypothetical protein